MSRLSDTDRIVQLETSMESVLPMLEGLDRRLRQIEPQPRDLEAEHKCMFDALLDLSVAGIGGSSGAWARDRARAAIRSITPLR